MSLSGSASESEEYDFEYEDYDSADDGILLQDEGPVYEMTDGPQHGKSAFLLSIEREERLAAGWKDIKIRIDALRGADVDKLKGKSWAREANKGDSFEKWADSIAGPSGLEGTGRNDWRQKKSEKKGKGKGKGKDKGKEKGKGKDDLGGKGKGKADTAEEIDLEDWYENVRRSPRPSLISIKGGDLDLTSNDESDPTSDDNNLDPKPNDFILPPDWNLATASLFNLNSLDEKFTRFFVLFAERSDKVKAVLDRLNLLPDVHPIIALERPFLAKPTEEDIENFSLLWERRVPGMLDGMQQVHSIFAKAVSLVNDFGLAEIREVTQRDLSILCNLYLKRKVSFLEEWGRMDRGSAKWKDLAGPRCVVTEVVKMRKEVIAVEGEVERPVKL